MSSGHHSRPHATHRAAPRGGTMLVAIFYEDIASAERALRSLRALLRSRHDSRVIQPMLWQTGLLEHAHWLRLATADAERAELCVVSTSRQRSGANSIMEWFRALAPIAERRWVTLAPFEAMAEHHDAVLRTG